MTKFKFCMFYFETSTETYHIRDVVWYKKKTQQDKDTLLKFFMSSV